MVFGISQREWDLEYGYYLLCRQGREFTGSLPVPVDYAMQEVFAKNHTVELINFKQ